MQQLIRTVGSISFPLRGTSRHTFCFPACRQAGLPRDSFLAPLPRGTRTVPGCCRRVTQPPHIAGPLWLMTDILHVR